MSIPGAHLFPTSLSQRSSCDQRDLLPWLEGRWFSGKWACQVIYDLGEMFLEQALGQSRYSELPGWSSWLNDGVWRPSTHEMQSHEGEMTEVVSPRLEFIFCCSVARSRLTLCDPMDCSTPGFPVLYHLPELAQIHVHWVGDAIQPSCPLSSPSPLALNLSQHRIYT